MILADLGADVIKIESAPHGDSIRSWGTKVRGESTYNLAANRNKRGVLLNYRAPLALEAVRTMATNCEAIREWGAIPSTDRYAMLDRIRQPALVVHGNKDVVVTPINAFILAQHLPNAQLVMYPDASHGAQSQHAGVFLEHARMFLNE
jgi:pimeloyl-ACP methyl ester carboxylesterase